MQLCTELHAELHTGRPEYCKLTLPELDSDCFNAEASE